jgi:microcystin degradation protein MlrC
MGDNVGGGSAADGTCVAKSLSQRRIGPSFVCIYDPQSVRECQEHIVGDELRLCIGGKTDHQHGTPWECTVAIKGFHEGKFTEDRPRHGGITAFDQGPSVVVELREAPITVLLTSRRMVPFSLNQLSSCNLDPRSFRVLVAKGVHAPLAAYREVCDAFLRVNTPGSTCADLFELNYRNRRKPLFPFEKDF